VASTLTSDCSWRWDLSQTTGLSKWLKSLIAKTQSSWVDSPLLSRRTTPRVCITVLLSVTQRHTLTAQTPAVAAIMTARCICLLYNRVSGFHSLGLHVTLVIAKELDYVAGNVYYPKFTNVPLELNRRFLVLDVTHLTQRLPMPATIISHEAIQSQRL